MIIILKTTIAFLILNIIISQKILSQQDTTNYNAVKIILFDGSRLNGQIIKEDSVLILFKTVSNIQISIPKEQIKKIEKFYSNETYSNDIKQDPNRTRLFFAPTGRSLKYGESYISAYQLFFPFIAFGLTNYFILAGGISIIPGMDNQIFYVAPKAAIINNKNFSVSSGVLYIGSTANATYRYGIIYGVSSYDFNNASISGGFGYGFSGNKINKKPVIMIGVEAKVSNSIKLISENWLPIDADISLISFGVRFFGEKLAADLGFIRPIGKDFEIEGFPFLPWLGFAYNFSFN